MCLCVQTSSLLSLCDPMSLDKQADWPASKSNRVDLVAVFWGHSGHQGSTYEEKGEPELDMCERLTKRRRCQRRGWRT